MKTTTRYVDDDDFESVNETGRIVRIDTRSGEHKRSQSPMELLLSSLAACSSVDLIQMLKKRRRTVNGLTVEAEGARRQEHPRAFTNIRLTFRLRSPDVGQTELEKYGLLAATKYCSVAGTLNAQIDHEFVIEP